ncbi:MAG TPA: methyltransferase domain-containing protein [Bellilinea sp.]|nr:methyltransferase domain-containing protein [Bellilinea sp.]
MYDQFSSNYDRFVNWQGRLAFEMPLLVRLLQPLQISGQVVRVLDAACGTGMHAIELTRRGFAASGADLSAGMIDQARSNSATAGLDTRFEAVGFGKLADTFGVASQDAVLCLGNSLPHALTAADRRTALTDFSACLRPGGILVTQNRNFDKVLAARERWMEPQSFTDSAGDWIFLRFYDYLPDGLINFNIITLQRAAAGWQQTVTTTQLYPLRQAELLAGLAEAGFDAVQLFGSMDGSPYDPVTSDNLIVSATKE